MIIYIANGTVLHNVRYDYDEVLEINGERVIHTFPQALPNLADIKAYREETLIDRYARAGGEVVSVAEYEKERRESNSCTDEDSDDDGDIIATKAKLKWLEFSDGISPIYKKVRTDITPEVINFSTADTGSPYISCAPSLIGGAVDLKKGEYFCFRPDLGRMLAEAAIRAGLLAAKTEIGKNDTDLKYAMYNGKYMFLSSNHENYSHGDSYITLERARAHQKCLEDLLDCAFTRWKAEHNPTSLTVGVVVKEIENWKSLLLGIMPNGKGGMTTKHVLLKSMENKKNEWGELGG